MRLTVNQFCLALRYATLSGADGRLGPRDDLSADGECIYAMLEWIEQKHGAEEVEAPDSLEGVFALVQNLGGNGGMGMLALRKRLTVMPNFAKLLESRV